MARRRRYKPKTILPDELMERVTLRKAVHDDVYFCRDTFKMAHKKSKQFSRCTVERDVIRGADARFHHFLNWADLYVCTHVEGEPILGWIAVTPMQVNTIVWFVYTKHAYRHMGLARFMINNFWRGRIYYPFDTRRAGDFAEKFQAHYNPFIYEELCFERPDKESVYLRKFATGEQRRIEAKGGTVEASEDFH